MAKSSFAARMVADGPATLAPPSFEGMGWLVALNMFFMTIAFLGGTMVVAKLVGDWVRHRRQDTPRSPAAIYRLIGILFAAGITVRCGAEALALWGWDPREPMATATYLTLKRFLDPVAVTFGLSGMMIYVMSEPGMIEQQRKEPWPINMWMAWPMVKRMLKLAGLTFIAAVGVVSLR